jgi:hypothetical protein
MKTRPPRLLEEIDAGFKGDGRSDLARQEGVLAEPRAASVESRMAKAVPPVEAQARVPGVPVVFRALVLGTGRAPDARGDRPLPCSYLTPRFLRPQVSTDVAEYPQRKTGAHRTCPMRFDLVAGSNA